MTGLPDSTVGTSATIIQFPRKPVRTEYAHSSERLASALSDLAAALAEQKACTMRWRSALEELTAKMQVLSAAQRGQKIG